MIFLAIGAFSLHASSEGEASSALSSSPQSGPRASTASRVCPAPKQLTEPWPRPSLSSVRCFALLRRTYCHALFLSFSCW